ncbi:hypothetical protein BDW74DRAFT_185999 [Aspergillus multicolor]|uniref:uncharacterized protein n=1 Tax=Aspergillus multicolor TaxID=41759 RepID=UPI003CCCC382
MDIQRQFPTVHWIWGRDISFDYEVHPLIVVKVPKPGELERKQFHRELEIYRIFSQNDPCPSIVQCFYFSENGIFLEYMRGKSLFSRIQNNHIYDRQTMVVTKEWMNDLAQAVAYLESLNLAHGDLRPENILLDRDRLKLSDFDCTAKIGAEYEACMAPYGRILNSRDTDQGKPGTFGFLGPRTEQFALGSLFYLINYGFEVYGDRCLTEDPYEHGPKVVDLLQNVEFPTLDGNPQLDDIINKCCHDKYVTVSELAAHTKLLCGRREQRHGRQKERGRSGSPIIATFIVRWRMILGCILHTLWCGLGGWWAFVFQSTNNKEKTTGKANQDSGHPADQTPLKEEYTSKRAICQDLEKRGLLRVLSSDEPGQLGFTVEWYRHNI